MELADAVRRRRTVRAFEDRPVDADLVDAILDLARRHPAAGNAWGTGFLVLDHPDDRRRFWDVTADPAWDRDAAWPAVTNAAVIVLPLANRQAYLDRYAEPDKAALGRSEAEAWPVPYWLVDTAFATMTLLLAVTDAGLGGFFHGLFGAEAGVRAAFAIPDEWQPIGAVAIGHPALDRPSRSAGRGRPPRDVVIRRGSWRPGAISE